MRAVVVFLFSLVLVACGGASKPPAAASPKASETAPAAESAAPAHETVAEPASEAKPKAEPDVAKPLAPIAPTVKLLDPGAAPRRALRYKFKKGVTEYVEMDMKMAMAMAIEGQNSPKTDLPTIRTTMKIEATEVTPDGDLRCAYRVEKVDVLKDMPLDPTTRANLEKELGGMLGMQGKALISPRGVAKENDFELPATASQKLKAQMDNMRDSIRQIYAPLPQEEVGKGAKWDVTSRIPLRGAMMDSKITYTLTKLEKDSVTADVATTLSAPPNQPMQLDTLPAGSSATLVSLSGEGLGKVSPSFVHLASNGTNKLSMNMAMKVSVQDKSMQMAMQSDIAVVSRPGKKPAAAPAVPKK